MREAFQLASEAKRASGEPEIDDTLGWIYCRLGQYPAAIKHLEDSASQLKGARVRYHLAVAYFGAGDRSRGLKTLAAARKLDRSLPEAAVAKQMADAAR